MGKTAQEYHLAKEPWKEDFETDVNKIEISFSGKREEKKSFFSEKRRKNKKEY